MYHLTQLAFAFKMLKSTQSAFLSDQADWVLINRLSSYYFSGCICDVAAFKNIHRLMAVFQVNLFQLEFPSLFIRNLCVFWWQAKTYHFLLNTDPSQVCLGVAYKYTRFLFNQPIFSELLTVSIFQVRTVPKSKVLGVVVAELLQAGLDALPVARQTASKHWRITDAYNTAI